MPIGSLGSRELRGEWEEIAVNGPKKTPDSKQETGDCQSGCIYQFFSSRVSRVIRIKHCGFYQDRKLAWEICLGNFRRAIAIYNARQERRNTPKR